MAQSKPIEKFRAGQVSCALWENELRVNGGSRTVKVLKDSVSCCTSLLQVALISGNRRRLVRSRPRHLTGASAPTGS